MKEELIELLLNKMTSLRDDIESGDVRIEYVSASLENGEFAGMLGGEFLPISIEEYYTIKLTRRV